MVTELSSRTRWLVTLRTLAVRLQSLAQSCGRQRHRRWCGRGDIAPLYGPVSGAGKAVGESRAVIDIAGEPCVHWQIRGEAGVECVALIVVDGRVTGTKVARWIVGDAAGESADDVAALLGDPVGVSEIEAGRDAQDAGERRVISQARTSAPSTAMGKYMLDSPRLE